MKGEIALGLNGDGWRRIVYLIENGQDVPGFHLTTLESGSKALQLKLRDGTKAGLWTEPRD
jgi:hypothetical protein